MDLAKVGSLDGAPLLLSALADNNDGAQEK